MRIKRTGQVALNVPYILKNPLPVVARTAEGRRIYARTIPVTVKPTINKRIERRWVS